MSDDALALARAELEESALVTPSPWVSHRSFYLASYNSLNGDAVSVLASSRNRRYIIASRLRAPRLAQAVLDKENELVRMRSALEYALQALQGIGEVLKLECGIGVTKEQDVATISRLTRRGL
jgi:hypothetical protein